MTVVGRGTLGAAAVLLLGALVALSTTGLVGALAALTCAVVVTLLVVLGPERLGTGFVLLALFTAPQNSVRPIPTADFVTFSDLFLALGAGLLLPTLLRRRSRYPMGWLVGSVGVIVLVLIASMLSETPGIDLFYGIRLPAATVALPLFFLMWAPSRRLIDVLAWCYVAGHVTSTAYAVVTGQDPATGRYDGLTTHYNFFGIAGTVTAGLLIHLYHRTPRRWRWVVWGAGLATVGSVSMSGSRAAVLVLAMLVVLYPLLERSLLSGYLVVAGGLGLVFVGNALLGSTSEGSAFSRIRGDSTTSFSDNERTVAIKTGWSRFLEHPILGGGFDAHAYDAHNVYLEIAIGIGVVGLAFHLLVFSTGVLPLFGTGPLRRLGYAPLGYAAMCMLTNSIWDRFVWMGIALAVVAAVDRPDDPPGEQDDMTTTPTAVPAGASA
ncbi:O-antigen ligase family protein [Nocardioides halotolerans]|uniref:O-antigen ligase family protein n=1 Tax=Nocardioides halotolerans TaxID=433660 RepID=UPI0004103307|nr:O-antigen ligase family protein [Nocardioides halotolerans]